MKRRLGFTLVELVIVIAVIGILATVLVPTFGAIIDKANKSTDVQTAGNLTTLIAMYSVENPIESEADIAAAINEGKGDDTFYQNLKAKSAKQGYCFWYEYSSGQVLVETLEKIIEKSQAPAETTMGPVGRSAAPVSGLRDAIVPGYILMGSGNNDLLNLVVALENADAETYADTLAAIQEAGIESLKNAVNATAIHNDNGVFAPTNTVTGVHIPQTAEKLNNNVVVADGTDLSLAGITVVIPKGTIVGGGSLGYLDNTCTVKVKVVAEELPVTIELCSTVATIFVSNGDGYLQDVTRYDANIFHPINGGAVITGEVDPSVLLKSFSLGDNENAYVYIDTSKQIIYVSKDLTGAFDLVAGSFTSEKGSTTSGFLTWKLNGSDTPLTNKGKTISITPDVTEVEVSTMGVEYTYTVKPVMVDRFEVLKFGGIDYGRNLGYGTQDNNAVIGTWGLEVDIHMTDGLTLDQIKVDQTISIVEANSSDLFKLIGVDDKHNATLSIFTTENEKEVLKISGDQYKKPIKFACGLHGYKTAQMEISLIDSSKSAFKIIDDVNTQTKYNFPFVVGTTGHVITLDQLFAAKTGVQVTGHVMVSTNGGNTWKEYTAKQWSDGIALNDFVNDANKETGALNLTIKVEGGNYDKDEEKNSIPLVLKVVPGAYNVTTPAEWVSATGSIVLLNDLDIDGDKELLIDGKEVSKADYLKTVGSGAVYGNLKTITVKNFVYNTAGQANSLALIAINNGAVDRVIINGPEYGKVVSITGNDSKNKGTYVHGVHTEGTSTISNSLISGFRAPVQVWGGTTTLQNTVLSKGNYANISVDGSKDVAKEIVADGLTTVQYETSGGSGDDAWSNIGAGFAVKYNSGNTTIREINNGLKQYNYLTQTQIQSIAQQASGIIDAEELGLGDSCEVQGAIDAVINIIVNLKGDMPKINGIKHNDYYHLGIFEMELALDFFGKGVTGNPSVTCEIDGFDTKSIPKNTYVAGTITVNISGEPTCSGGCAHGNLPMGDNNQALNSFGDYKAAFLKYGWKLQ